MKIAKSRAYNDSDSGVCVAEREIMDQIFFEEEEEYQSVPEWIKNRYYYSEFDETKMQNILHFALVWNIFERECCGNSANIGNSPNLAAALDSKELPSLNSVWHHFWTRYVKNGHSTPIFNNFKFNSGDKQEWVRTILLSDSPSQSEKIEALLRIIFRLRNNLMHGIKEPEKFYEQDENFKYANLFLMDVCNHYE